MDVNRKELSAIKEVLKESPRGMTVTEISRSVKMNRHSVAKYLEVLVVAGHVDMKTFGPSKVYYLSQRVPVSAMLSFSSDLIVILDKDLRARNLNDKFLEYTGMKREDILNKKIENFAFSRLTEPPLLPGIRDALDGKERTVNTYYHSGVRDYYLVIKFIPTIFEDGEKGVTIIASDYTEHKHIEKTVRENERKFRDMLEQSTDGIIMSDERGVIIEYNKSLEQLTGYPKDDVVGKHVWEIPFFQGAYGQIPNRLPKQLKSYINGFLRTGESPLTDQFSEYEIERPDGTVRTIHANIFPIKTDKGFMLCAIARDITSMKNAEMEIRDNEEKFRSVIEQSLDGIALVDEQGKIIEFNKQLEDITGLKKKDIVGMEALDIFSRVIVGTVDKSPDSLQTLKEQLKSGTTSYEDGGKVFFEVEIVKPGDDHRILQAMAFPILMEKSKINCAIVRDVTEQKRAEVSLLKEHVELEARVKERTAELQKANEKLRAEIERRIGSENALRDSEERFRNLVESVNDVVWEKDKDGKYTYLSPRMHDVLGYEPEEMLGRVLLEFMPVGEASKIFDDYWDLFKNPSTYSFQKLQMRKKSGEVVIIESRGSPCFDKVGDFQGYRGIARDITQRTQIENALLKSEEKYRNFTENINDVAWEKGKDGKFTYMSPKIRDSMGYGPEEFIGKTILDFMIPADVEAIGDDFWRIFRDPMPYSLREMRVLHKDGHEVFVEANGIPVYDEHGNFQGYRGVTRDVTSRKRAEEALQKIEDKYRTLVENINDVAWEFDKNARFIYVSPKVRDIMGYSPEHYLGKVMTDFMPPDDAARFSEPLGRILANPRPFGLEHVRMYHRDGTVMDLEANGTPFFDEKGGFCGFRGVTRNVTKRKRMEEMHELMKYSIDHSEDAAFWVNPDAGFYYVNDAACRMLGYSREELLTMNIKDIDVNFTPEDWGEHWEMLKWQKYHKMESLHRTKEGGTFLVEITDNYLEFNGKEYDFAFVRPISPPRHGISRPLAIEEPKNRE
jgi:PAS domain S-box-containing protein